MGGMIPPGFGGFVLGAVKGALDFWFLEDVETIIDKDTTFTQKATAAFFLTPFGKGPKAAQKTYKLSRTAMGGKIKKVEKVEGSKQSWFLEGTDGAGEIGWSISKGGGVINGRKYSQHALERMAPDIPEVRASLTSRAIKKAEELGFKPQTKEFSDFIKKYVDPRNIPPSVIEDAIRSTKKTPGNRSGTFVHETQDVKVIINEAGDVITVIPK